MDKGTTLGKRDTTLPHRGTFSRKFIPETDKRLDEEGMSRLKSRMKKVGGTLMSDKQSCRREMDEGIKKDIWSVMENFSTTPGGKDFSKMKTQYTMFVDAVVSKQMCVSIICMTLHYTQLCETQLITMCVLHRFDDEVKDVAPCAFTPEMMKLPQAT
jgi:hypothetical protein